MKFKLLTSTCVVGLAVAAHPAVAQQEPTGAAQPETAIDQPQGGLQDIVVTAQRRSENLQRAAIAVSAVTGDTLTAAGVTRPSELTAVIPSLQVAAPAGPFNIFYLRGVGNFNTNAFSDAAVAFNVDGVFLGRPSSTTGFFYDLERVEVVKGPQGTLYGRNATGGAINVLTKKPDLQKFGANASIEYGNYDQLRLDGAINVPLGEIAAVRVAGFRVEHDGYMNDDTDDQDDWGGRAAFRVEPTDDLRISVVGDYYEQAGHGPGSTPLVHVSGQPFAGSALVPATFSIDDRISQLSPAGQALYTSLRAGPLNRPFVRQTLEPFQQNRFWGISSTIDWQTSVGTLTVIPAYREGKLNYLSFGPGFFTRQRENQNQTTLEARFATSEDFPLRALLGAFYYDENIRDPQVAYVHQVNGQWQQDINLNTKSKALFGRLAYAVTPDFRFNAGARQTWDDKQAQGDSQTFTRICNPAVTNCLVAPPLPYVLERPAPTTLPGLVDAPTRLTVNNSKEFKKFTWRVGADWDITPRNLLYASFETGFKAGGFFFSIPDAQGRGGTFEPEAIKAFTLGSKNRFFDNRVQINAELFRWRYSNQQISFIFPVAGVPVFGTQNAGRATFKGVEVETRFAATDTTTLNADVQYLDAVYNQFPMAVGVGKRPPNAPRWSINLGVEQRIPVSFGEFVLNGRTHYQTKTLTGLEFLPIQYQDGYWLADAQITYNAPERRFFVGAFINNMFDETVKSQGFPAPFASVPTSAAYTASVAGSGFIATTLRPLRTYGVRAGVRF